MKKVLLVGFVLFYGILGCTIKDNEIISLINSLKKQNDELLIQLGSVKKTTDSALVAVAKLNASQGPTDAKIEAVKLDLQTVLAQIAALNVQITNNTGEGSALKTKVEALQLKCAELLAQITYLTKISQVFPLKVDVSPAGSGTIQISPITDAFKYGTEVTLTVTPSTNYIFKQWTGDTTTTSNPLKFKVTKNFNITAVLDNVNTLTIKDIDGNTYKAVKIGTQVWMAENLKTTKFSNGESITYVDKSNESSWSTIGSFRAYNYDLNNKATFGLLYNGQAVFDSRNICPNGWHIPSENDWQILEQYIGLPQLDLRTEGFRGQDLNIGGKLKQKGFINWNSPNSGATDEFGFNAIAAGRWTGGYIFLYNETGFWSSTSETNDFNAWIRVLGYSGQWILKGKSNDGGWSCRCIKN